MESESESCRRILVIMTIMMWLLMVSMMIMIMVMTTKIMRVVEQIKA